MSEVRTRRRSQLRNGNFQQSDDLRRLPQTAPVRRTAFYLANAYATIDFWHNEITHSRMLIAHSVVSLDICGNAG